MAPPTKIKGNPAIQTKVMSHPFEKAIANPAANIARAIIIVDIFYPIAPWKANESVANLVANYDWLIVSNQPISCLKRLLRYSLLQAIP